MKFAQTSKMLGSVALALIASPFALAQDSNWYIGANIGKSKANIDDARIATDLLGAGITLTSIQDREKDTGFKILLGYQFNKYFALEGGYYDLGRFGFSSTTLPAGTLDGSIYLRGLNFDAVLTLPITEKFSAFGRIGTNFTNAQDTFIGTGSVNVLDPRPSKRDANYKAGVGLEYDFTKHFGMRAEVERYRVNDAVGHKGNIDMASIGVIFRFGRNEPVTRQAAYEPVAAPEPVIVDTPVLVVVPVAAVTEQYCTILDIQFEIDESNMQREEKEKLGVVGTFMTKYPNTTAVIEGHTDNVGTTEHNMDLSLNRAQSVVNYLVDSLKISSSRLKAVGYGDSRPLADNDTEEGKRKNRRIDAVVACATDIEGLSVAPARMTMAMLIEFDRNKADVKPQYSDDLRKVANFLKKNPSLTATVEGHTGNLQATPKLAMEISKNRAQNVVNYLVDNFGIERSRLTSEGFGRSRKFAYNTSIEGQQENRRVNIIIDYPRGSKTPNKK